MSYLGEDIKKLGFGLMRLPKNGEEIDIEETKKMVDLFIAAGFTYFDTAYVYGGSEEAIKKALVERYPRDSYTLATKLAPWIGCKTREEAMQQFDESLARTGAGYFDFYLLHNFGGSHSKVFEDFDLWSFVKEKKEEGLIKHIGFSAHTNPEEVESIIKNHPEVEFVQLQINYADWEDKDVQSRACYEVCRKYDKPVVIMEPVKGGMLANPHESVTKILKEAEPEMSAASWGVRFAASLPGVLTVLSGMSSVEQMEDNLSYMKDFTVLTEEEQEVIKKAQEALKQVPIIQCTGCNYCAKVCPMGIGISGTFKAVNTYTLFNNLSKAKERIRWNVEEKGLKTADECLQCGACEDACPQHLSIREELQKAAELFG